MNKVLIEIHLIQSFLGTELSAKVEVQELQLQELKEGILELMIGQYH